MSIGSSVVWCTKWTRVSVLSISGYSTQLGNQSQQVHAMSSVCAFRWANLQLILSSKSSVCWIAFFKRQREAKWRTSFQDLLLVELPWRLGKELLGWSFASAQLAGQPLKSPASYSLYLFKADFAHLSFFFFLNVSLESFYCTFIFSRKHQTKYSSSLCPI